MLTNPRTLIKDHSRQLDTFLGKKLRARRIEMGISQAQLGSAIGVSYQQIQKYEKANDRISCSMLYEISKCLDCGIGWFFEGFGEDDLIISSPDSLEIKRAVSAYLGIKDISLRKKIIAIMKTMSADA